MYKHGYIVWYRGKAEWSPSEELAKLVQPQTKVEKILNKKHEELWWDAVNWYQAKNKGEIVMGKIKPLNYYGDLHPVEYDHLSDYDKLALQVHALLTKINEVIEVVNKSATTSSNKQKEER